MKQEKEQIKTDVIEEGVSVKHEETKISKPKPELSEEAIQERMLLEGLLIHQTEVSVREAVERRKRIEQEEIELRSGEKISIAQVRSIITASRQAYDAVFPNDVDFYKEIYRLNGWKHLDPKEYIKPPMVGTWTIEMLYNRLGKDVFPALSALNPAFPNGIRLHKCFQFLTDDGRKHLIDFRDESIRLMKKCTTWNGFREMLFEECGVPYQKSLFEEKT